MDASKNRVPHSRLPVAQSCHVWKRQSLCTYAHHSNTGSACAYMRLPFRKYHPLAAPLRHATSPWQRHHMVCARGRPRHSTEAPSFTSARHEYTCARKSPPPQHTHTPTWRSRFAGRASGASRAACRILVCACTPRRKIQPVVSVCPGRVDPPPCLYPFFIAIPIGTKRTQTHEHKDPRVRLETHGTHKQRH